MNATYGVIVGAQYIPSYIEYTNSSADQQVQWSILDAGSTHNNVLDVNFADSTRQGQLFLGHPDSNKATQDLSQFQTGTLEFDLRVLNEGSAYDAVAGGVVFALRMDCLWPCAAHETLVTVGASESWTHIALPIADLIATGLDISNVNNSLIIVPQGPQAHLHLQLDNVKLVAGGPVVAGPNVIFKEDFNGTSISNWTLTNFVGTATTTAGPTFGAVLTLDWNAVNDTVGYETTLSKAIDITNKKASFQINCFKNTSQDFSYQMIATDANGVKATSSSNYATSLTPATWYEVSTDLGNSFPNGFDATQIKKVGLQFVYLGSVVPASTLCYVDTIRITSAPSSAASSSSSSSVTTTSSSSKSSANSVPGSSSSSPIVVISSSSLSSIMSSLSSSSNSVASSSLSSSSLVSSSSSSSSITSSLSSSSNSVTSSSSSSSVNSSSSSLSSSSSSVSSCSSSSGVIFSECMNSNYGVIVGAQYLPSYIEYTTSNAGQQVQWSISDAGSTHNNVLDVNFADNSRQGQLFLGHPDSNPATQDLSQFQTGTLEFDLRVLADGDAYDAVAGGVVFGLRMDCLWPCASHPTLVTVAMSTSWTHVTLPISDMIASGLDISQINNSLIIVPQGQQAHLHFQLDNVELVAGGPVVAGPNVIFKEDFNGTSISNWSFTNFVGTATTSAGANFGAVLTLGWNAVNDTVGYETTLVNAIDITNKKSSFQINCFKNTSLNFSYQMIATDVNGMTATSTSNYATSLTPDIWSEIAADLADNLPNGFDATQVTKVGLQFIYLGGAPATTRCYVDTIRITE